MFNLAYIFYYIEKIHQPKMIKQKKGFFVEFRKIDNRVVFLCVYKNSRKGPDPGRRDIVQFLQVKDKKLIFRIRIDRLNDGIGEKHCILRIQNTVEGNHWNRGTANRKIELQTYLFVVKLF